ncbi:Hypothetical_protein [Hexamita inflata]|uniref:Hypothetical_protein n=1 Tax=Hexamita inflata TaxID=28002 RepID=A0ABP1GJL9_9EUKA
MQLTKNNTSVLDFAYKTDSPAINQLIQNINIFVQSRTLPAFQSKFEELLILATKALEDHEYDVSNQSNMLNSQLNDKIQTITKLQQEMYNLAQCIKQRDQRIQELHNGVRQQRIYFFNQKIDVSHQINSQPTNKRKYINQSNKMLMTLIRKVSKSSNQARIQRQLSNNQVFCRLSFKKSKKIINSYKLLKSKVIISQLSRKIVSTIISQANSSKQRINCLMRRNKFRITLQQTACRKLKFFNLNMTTLS